jgi:hypothetical protein
MFQVEVEKVLFAAGAPKKSKEEARMEANLKKQEKHFEEFKERAIAKAAERKAAGETPAKETEAATEGEAAEGETAEAEETWRLTNRNLKFVLKEVKRILKSDPKDLTATEKRQLRYFRTNAKRFLSQPEDSELDAENLLRELSLQMKSHELMRETFERFSFEETPAEGEASAEASTEAQATEDKPALNRSRQIAKGFAELTEEQKEKAMRIMGDTQLSREEMRKLGQLLRNDEENPYDESKPYATPWRPRPFLAPFAFIPRYLEVNPNICAAVYLRHPVARKGLAEVPTPFNYLTNQLTHNWYVERG